MLYCCDVSSDETWEDYEYANGVYNDANEDFWAFISTAQTYRNNLSYIIYS